MGHRTLRTTRLTALAAVVVAGAVAAAPAAAWGEYGHRATAAIALENVTPQTRAGIARLLRAAPQIGTPDCALATLGDAAVWPDCIRAESWRWAYTFAWHYQTQPITSEYDPRRNCSGGACVTAQITRSQRLLADERLSDAIRLEALAFLVHFAGDIHMPLHSGDNEDRGGNDRTVRYGIVPSLNLHYVWDGPLAERAISAATPALARRYGAEERAALAGGGPADWGRESWSIARTLVYPQAFACDPCGEGMAKEGALDQAAIEAATPVAERRIVQAGLRIAAYLDAAFALGPLDAD